MAGRISGTVQWVFSLTILFRPGRPYQLKDSPEPRAPITPTRRSLAGRFYGRVLLFPDRRNYLGAVEGLEEVTFSAREGRRIFGLRVPAHGELSSRERPTVVFLHGNSANLTSHWLYVELLREAGCDVLAFDYGGFGRSEGRPCVVEMVDDARAACHHAQEWHEQLGKTGPIGLFGLSVGSNLALHVAGDQPEIGAVAVEGVQIQREMIRGITVNGLSGPRWIEDLRGPDGEAIERDRFRFPGLRLPEPFAGWMGRLAEWTYPFPGKDAARSAGRLGELPLLITHGTDDRLLPFETALRVFQARRAGSRLWLLPGVGHAQEPALVVDEEYVAQLADFFRRTLIDSRPVEITEVTLEGSEAVIRSLDPRESVAVQIAVIEGDRLGFHRRWLEGGSAVHLPVSGPEAEVVVTPVFRAEREGGGWRPVESARARVHASATGSTLRAVSSKLHDRRVLEARDLLAPLVESSPPFPFNFLARLHCARLEDLARKPHPEVARQARAWFEQLASSPES